MPSVHAEAAEQEHQVTLALEVTPKQVGQLYREWYSIADVIHVSSSTGLHDQRDGANAGYGSTWTGPHPPASTGPGREEARAALA
jgi:hypothetical protein